MKTKILIILIILIGLTVGGFFAYKNINIFVPKEQEKPSEEAGLPGPEEVLGPEERLGPKETLEEFEIPEAMFEEEPTEEPKEAPMEKPIEEAQPEEEIILPTQKLLSWQKEDGIRLPGGVSVATIFRAGQYWMYYTGPGGIRLAKSSDGLNFQEYGLVVADGPLGSDQEMVTNPAIFQLKNGKYRLIYEGNQDRGVVRKLYSALSNDGLLWTKETGIRLEDSIFYEDPKKGTAGYVVFASVPDVIRIENDCLRLYYAVVDELRIAESCDEGLTWEKRGKVMFDIYLEVAQDPDIIKLEDGTYKLFFSTQNSERNKQWIVSAFSEDGINFKVEPDKRIEPAPGEDRAIDPDVVKLPDGTYRMYYGKSSSNWDDFDILSAISQD